MLVIANFRDVQADWKISTEELQKLVDELCILNPNSSSSDSRDSSMDEFIQAESQFNQMMRDIYSGTRRIMKLIETSFLEKFGLHVG